MINQTIATKLIKLYDYVCQKYKNELQYHVARFSNNHSPDFTDEELMTIYLFAVHQEKRFKLKDIYNFTHTYLLDWFPKLPSYPTFCSRLNRLSEAFRLLTTGLIQEHKPQNMNTKNSLIDSFPVITCSGKRNPKVATELTDKTYSASKNIWYHGIKIHVLAFQTAHQMPHAEHIILTKASEHDLVTMKENLSFIENRTIFADKAYCNKTYAETIFKEQNTKIKTPKKVVKNQSQSLNYFDKAANDLYSKTVATIRQPIESLFNWLIEKTDIQNASKVRSQKGLLVHIYGKLAAAFLKFIF